MSSASKANNAIKAGRAAFNKRLAGDDRATAKRVSDAYKRTLETLNKRLADLRAIAGEDGMTPRKFTEEAAVVRLRDDLRTELGSLESAITREATRAEQLGINQARLNATATLHAVGMEGSFNTPSVEAIRALVGYVDSGPFKQAVEGYAKYHADQVSDLILMGASKGMNPIAIARQVTNYVEKFPRADALRMVRTVQIWSARQGTLAIYRANADVVQGWVWSAAIGDPNTCESCVMMHGTVHRLEETLDDHHNGRCAPVPITPSWADLGLEGGTDLAGIETGIDWFNSQNDATQQQVLGMAKWQAWKDGGFDLSDLSTTYQDPVYGPMRRAASLTELVGRDAARAYINGKAA